MDLEIKLVFPLKFNISSLIFGSTDFSVTEHQLYSETKNIFGPKEQPFGISKHCNQIQHGFHKFGKNSFKIMRPNRQEMWKA
jgi:uncharacterized protein (DUF2141 family)